MSQVPASSLARLLLPAAILVGVGAFGYLSVAVLLGFDSLVQVIVQTGPWVLLGGTLLSFGSYFFRFAKWDISLRALGSSVSWGLNLRVYLSGLALTASPGKLGEAIRGIALVPQGVRLEKSLASFFVDRLCDVAAVGLLGFAAGLITGKPFWLLLAFPGVVFLVLTFLKPLLRIDWLRHRSFLARLAEGLSYISTLWTVRRVPAFLVLSAVAYGLQGVIFVWFCQAGGFPLGWVDGVAVYCQATLLGAASMIPGGLGAMEASLFFQLVERGCAEGLAFSLTVAFRFVTLWMGIGLGAVSLMSLGRVLRVSKRHEGENKGDSFL